MRVFVSSPSPRFSNQTSSNPIRITDTKEGHGTSENDYRTIPYPVPPRSHLGIDALDRITVLPKADGSLSL